MSDQVDQRAAVCGAVREAILARDTFVSATVTAHERAQASLGWQRARLRPVQLSSGAHTQCSYWNGQHDRTENYSGAELAAALDALLASDWQRMHVQTSAHDLHVRVTKKGRVLLTQSPPTQPAASPASHDHVKQRLLDPAQAGEFLRLLGITDAQQRVRPSMRNKFRQINSLAEIIDQAVARTMLEGEPIHVIDCGCGSAYLTFAAYYLLSELRGRQVTVEGVDVNHKLVRQVRQQAADLGWSEMAFHVASIAEVVPLQTPDLVLSLHACDTATDEALARGVGWGSRLILSAPCCQHELHNQLDEPTFRPVLRHGILRERLADVLTDAFRALALRIMGYRTTVKEFVDPAHTSRNIIIQAERGLPPGDDQMVQEYLALKRYWNVQPAIEILLGEPFWRLLTSKEP